MTPYPPLFLLTDFGTADPYVSQIKGVILTHAPQTMIIDLSHEVRPFDISQAGFFLWAGYACLPMGSVVLCVVDPGVGTSRRIVLIECEGRRILAPDNGLTALLLSQYQKGVSVFEIMQDLDGVSATFHGRDIFAPIAAKMVQGVSSDQLGTRISPKSLLQPSWAMARLVGDRLFTCVVHIDRFGNCLLNLPVSTWVMHLQHATAIILQSLECSLALVRTYGELKQNDIGILAGSQGVFEISMREQSAALKLGICPGDDLVLNLQ